MAAMGQVASGWLSSRLPGQRGLRGLGVDAQDPQALEEDISALCVLFEQAEAEHLVLPAAIDYHQEHLHLLRPQLCDDLRRKAAFPILHQRVDVLDGRDGTGHLGLAIVPVVNNDQVLEAPVDAVLPRDAVSRALRDIGARAPSDGLLGKVVHQILEPRLLRLLLLHCQGPRRVHRLVAVPRRRRCHGRRHHGCGGPRVRAATAADLLSAEPDVARTLVCCRVEGVLVTLLVVRAAAHCEHGADSGSP
mmetsp:Transcript_100253/g.258980  ORF Transcript_100253/g.258980 Transcript_100253/m.258980 type:complete len:248 (-) Transcript_100253:132-875(-)